MNLDAPRSPLPFLIGLAATQVARRPYLALSVAAHAALLALLYYFGSYQMALREQDAEVESSLRATSQASTAKRLQYLQTIKQLLEKSAGRDDANPEPGRPAAAPPETPHQMLDQARELSKAIDALDKEIQAEELAKLTGAPKPPAEEPAKPPAAAEEPAKPPAAAEPPAAPGTQLSAPPQAPVTQEGAASEIAALEAKARTTLAKRQQQLEAKANGVQVDANKAGAGGDSAGTGAGGARSSGKGQGPGGSVGAEIADFMGTGDANGLAGQSSGYNGGGSDFFDRGASQMPNVDAASMVRGHGRILGIGGDYANRVYLNSWYLIGPFAGRHQGGLFDNPSYPPEKAVLLDAVYYGKDKRLLKWRYVTSQSYPLVPPDMVEDSVYYGYTEVFVDQACDLTAWIGADDDVHIYLNDHLVWKGGNLGKQTYFDAIFDDRSSYLRDYNRTEGKRALHFNKGPNKVFFKLSNGPNSAFLSMVLTR